MSKLFRIVGSNIKKYRKMLNFSQEKLADDTGLHRTYIGSVERGERNISILNLEKIASALKIEPSQLLKENSEQMELDNE